MPMRTGPAPQLIARPVASLLLFHPSRRRNLFQRHPRRHSQFHPRHLSLRNVLLRPRVTRSLQRDRPIDRLYRASRGCLKKRREAGSADFCSSSFSQQVRHLDIFVTKTINLPGKSCRDWLPCFSRTKPQSRLPRPLLHRLQKCLPPRFRSQRQYPCPLRHRSPFGSPGPWRIRIAGQNR